MRVYSWVDAPYLPLAVLCDDADALPFTFHILHAVRDGNGDGSALLLVLVLV